MMIYYRIIFFILLLITGFKLDAQFGVYTNLNIDNGLKSNEVYHVYQDSKGYLWFSTDRGVSRFDGNNCISYDMDNGLPDNTVFEVFEDYKARIWFVPFSCKLSYFENDTIKEFAYSNNIQNVISTRPFPIKKSFYVDKRDKIYVSIYEEGIIEITEEGVISRNLGDSSKPDGIYFYNNGDISFGVLVGSRRSLGNSIYQINNDNDLLIDVVDEVSLIQGHIFTLPLGQDSFINVAGKVIYLSDNDGVIFKRIVSNEVIWISKDRSNNIYIGMKKGGVGVISSEVDSLLFDYFLLQGLSVTSVFEDTQGFLWATTLEKGAFSFLQNPSITNNIYLENEMIKCVERDFSDNIWIGGENGFVGYFSDNRLVSTYIPDIRDYSVNSIFSNNNWNETWVLSDRLLFSFSNVLVNLNEYDIVNSNSFSNAAFGGRKIIKSIDNNYWITNSIMLTKLDSCKEIVYNSYLNSNKKLRVEGLIENVDSSLFLGTLKGFTIFKDNEFSYPFRNHNLLNTRIIDFAIINECYLLGTNGRGLIFMDKDTLIQFTTEDGISSNIITSISFDDTYIWVGTSFGLNRLVINLHTRILEEITTIYSEDGLISNEINQVCCDDCQVIVAMDHGISIFDSDQIFIDTSRVPVYISGIKVLGLDQPLGDSLILPYEQNSISIYSIGISFINHDHLLYKYKLIGVDEDWIITEKQEVFFPFIPHGDYTFEVYAINPDGFESKEPARLKIKILPPYWRKLWFRFFIIAIIVITLLFLIIALKNSFFLKRKKRNKFEAINFTNRDEVVVQLDLFKEKLLYQQISPHFIFNALNSVRNFILRNEKEKSSLFLEEFSKLIRKVVEFTDIPFFEIKEEIIFLEHYLELESIRFDNKFKYEIELQTPGIENYRIPPMVIQPFVENAIWHAFDDNLVLGSLLIKFKMTKKYLICIVKDNGEGFEPTSEKKKKTKSFGISVTRKRINLINSMYGTGIHISYGEELISRRHEFGTLVEIKMPVLEPLD